ncbi:MAG: RNA methyltransferase [Chryseolinea sp.]
MHPIITSHHNPKIKNVIALEKQRERQAQQVFVVEGRREFALAADAGYNFISVFFCPEIIASSDILAIVNKEQLLIPVELSVFQKISYRDSTEGVVAIATQKNHSLDTLKLSSNPFIVVLEGLEKPGNLGAILRTADAAHVDAVIACDPKIDFYNPNVIRSSVGCIFTVATAGASVQDTIQWLKVNNINVLVTDLEASVPYHTVDYRSPSAVILGTESTGITQEWKKQATKSIVIPMRGKIDSMNVSNATAVIVFEAMRQREFQ